MTATSTPGDGRTAASAPSDDEPDERATATPAFVADERATATPATAADEPATATPATEPQQSMRDRWALTLLTVSIVLAVAVVLLWGWGIYRHNRLAGGLALVTAHVVLLATAWLDRWQLNLTPRPDRLWSIWIPRVGYPAGLGVGVIVAIDSANTVPQLLAIGVLLGLHVVTAAALAALVGHLVRGGASLREAWHLVVAAGIAVVGVAATVMVHVASVHRRFGLEAGVYIALASVAVVVAAGLVLFRMRCRGGDAAEPSLPLSVLVGYSCVVGGALVVMGSLVLMAVWRHGDPVAGPPIHRLPAIPGIVGEYVALGDSYSAGEGLRPFEPFTGDDFSKGEDGCHRSQLAYSQLLRFESPVPARRFVACSGAVISDIFTPFKSTKDGSTVIVPAQVPPGVHDEVGLVTISVGGNDAVFSSVVRHCFVSEHCLDARFVPPADDLERGVDLPAADRFSTWADTVLRGDADTTIERKIRALYLRLRNAYPRARIVVIGYPYLFPSREAPVLNLTDCQTILRRFDSSERKGVRARQDDLNQLLHDEAIAAGLEFVSPAAGWEGHEPCGESGEQYTSSIKPFFVTPLTGFNLGDGGTFHPTDAGQRELARLVTCYLVAHPERPSDDNVGDIPLGELSNPVPDCLV